MGWRGSSKKQKSKTKTVRPHSVSGLQYRRLELSLPRKMGYLNMTIIRNQECISHSPLELDVPRQSSWHVPRGSYHAHIRSVQPSHRLAVDFTTRLAKIIFNVHVPNTQLDYLAKIELRLDLREGSELWNLLCRLIGRKALQDCSEGKFNLEQLVGLECDVEIDHNCDRAEEHGFPLVIVTDVQEAGRLVRPSQSI